MKSFSKEDAMYEPLAASTIRRLTAEVATSALPDAPVRTPRTQPTPHRRAVAPRLRNRSATMLISLARRLDPDTQTVN
jgi:hypothetical protein